MILYCHRNAELAKKRFRLKNKGLEAALSDRVEMHQRFILVQPPLLKIVIRAD